MFGWFRAWWVGVDIDCLDSFITFWVSSVIVGCNFFFLGFMGFIVLLFLKNFLWAETNGLLEMFLSPSFYCFIFYFFERKDY